MNLNESQTDLGSNADDFIDSSVKSEENEKIIRILTNKILDSNPIIIEEFNNGETSAINEVVAQLQGRVDFDISDEAIRNIVGEEILIR